MPPKRAAAAAATAKARKPAAKGAKNAKDGKATTTTTTTSSTEETTETAVSSTPPPPAETSTAATKPKRASRKRAASVDDDSGVAEEAAPKRAKRVKTSAKETKETKQPKKTAKETKKDAPKAKEPKKRETKKEKEAKEKEAKEDEPAAAAPKRAKAVPKSRAAAAKKTATATATAAKTTKATRAKAEAPAKAPATKPREPTPVPAAPVAINKIPTTRFEVWSFGTGTVGELGVGPEKNYFKTPRPITALDANSVGVVQVSAGGMHVAALTHDGKIYTWGQNDSAALGRDTTWDGGKEKDMDDSSSDSDDELNLNPKEATPAAIPDGFLPEGTNVVQIAAGDCATFALTDTGLVYGWGIFRNENGSWGFYHKADTTPKREAIHIAELEHIVQIATGENYALALAQDGTVYSWGNGTQGQLGRQLQPHSSRLKEHALSLEEASLTPAPLPFPKRKIVSVHAASNHAFAVDKTGGVWAWGLNNYSQTGISTHAGESNAVIDLPRRVTNLKGYQVKMVQGGSHFSIGLTQDGKCLTWGRMDGAQIGVDFKNLPIDDEKAVMKDDRDKPRIMLKPAEVDIKDCTWVAAGGAHSIAVARDGKAYAWGFNDGYRCAVGDDMVDDVVEPHRIENKLMKDKTIIWAGAGGQYSLVGIEPEAAPVEEAVAAPAAASLEATPAETEKKEEEKKEEEEKRTEEEKPETNGDEKEEESKDEDGDSKMEDESAETKADGEGAETAAAASS